MDLHALARWKLDSLRDPAGLIAIKANDKAGDGIVAGFFLFFGSIRVDQRISRQHQSTSAAPIMAPI